MKARHLTHHGTRRDGDALDVLEEQNQLLRSLFADWAASDPKSDATSEEEVRDEWDQGTIGKLILEHAAVALAAREDIARVLGSPPGDQSVTRFVDRTDVIRKLLDRLDENSRGMAPMAVAGEPRFNQSVETLRETLSEEVDENSGADVIAGLTAALAGRRGELHSAKFLRKHAPTHPGPHRWYERVNFLVRIHAGYDRLRGFPWAESTPLANPNIADHYDRDV